MTSNFDMKRPARSVRLSRSESRAKSVESPLEPTQASAQTDRLAAKSKQQPLRQRLRSYIDRLPRPKHCLIRRYGLPKVLLVIGIFALIVIGGWFGYRWLTAPARITDIHFERSLSSRTTDAPTKREFTAGEPLMLVMSYTGAKPNTKATIILQKDGQDIRTIDIPHLRGDETMADHGKRYVSLVNGVATKLEPGDYKVRVVLNGSYTAVVATVIVK